MQVNDNMGGYESIEMIFLDHINSIIEDSNDRVSISLNHLGEYTNLPFQKRSAKIESKPKDNDAGTIYENSVSLLVPHQYLTDALSQQIKKAIYTFCVIRYKTVMGETFIVGGTDYPLQITSQKLHPGSVTGISGWQLEFTGKSTYPQRKLLID